MLLEGQDDRETRFKAMLQYLILREACEFDDRLSVDSGAGVGGGSEVQKKEESAEKILREMKLKFYDLFVEDDFPGNPYSILQEALKCNDNSKTKSNEDIFFILESMLCFKEQVPLLCIDNNKEFKDKIIDLISHRKAIDRTEQNNKKIFQSPKIENLIMTCDLASESGNSLISDIDKAYKFSNLASIQDDSLVKIRDEFLSESNNECCKIPENSIAIHAHINTATSLSLGFLNLTGKIITKALGDLSGGLFQRDNEDKTQGDNASPSKSVRGEKILGIVNSLYLSQGYI